MYIWSNRSCKIYVGLISFVSMYYMGLIAFMQKWVGGYSWKIKRSWSFGSVGLSALRQLMVANGTYKTWVNNSVT